MLDGEKYQIYKAMSICRHYERNTPGMASLDRKPLDLNVERYKVYSPNGVKYMYIYIIQGLRTRAPGGPPSSVESASRVRGGVCA